MKPKYLIPLALFFAAVVFLSSPIAFFNSLVWIGLITAVLWSESP